MKLLLDTHIWLWSLLDPNRLGPAVSKALQNSNNELWLSPISIWEFLVLVSKGRIELTEKPETWIARAWRAGPFKEAPITYEVAVETGRTDLPHRDPADLFLAASARVFDLTLVTADQRLLKVAGLRVFGEG